MEQTAKFDGSPVLKTPGAKEEAYAPRLRRIALDQHRLVYIPTPSEHERDPLNWSFRRKLLYLAIICFGAFATSTAPTSHATAYLIIAKTYHKSPTQLSYSIPAAVAGLLGGPFLIAPFAKILGRTAVIFWCILAVFALQIWSATSTSPSDYIAFVISRFLAGLFAATPTIIGTGYIMDIFFLHQRGFAFASYELSLLLGVAASPTIGGFIVQSNPWPVVFWWTLIPLGLAAILFALVIEDTEYAPGRSDVFVVEHSPRSHYLAKRLRFLLGFRVTPSITPKKFLHHVSTPFIIGIAPLTALAGFYNLVNFGWALLVNTELAIFLQIPSSEGGYGFSPTQTAAFTFTAWLSLATAFAFGAFYNDRVPIWLSNRRKGLEHGKWHPEDRLWSLLIGPASLSPIGLGIVGAALQYHLHYLVLALGYYLLILSAQLCVPVCVNYVVENFTRNPVEVSMVMNAYRLALGLCLGFFFEQWQKAVGVGWIFGSAAFFTLFAMGVLALTAKYSKQLRRISVRSELIATEDGEQLIDS